MSYSWNRFLYIIWLFITPFLFPWWVVGIFGVIGVFFFEKFFEIIAVGMLMDLAFGFSGNHWYTCILHTVSAGALFGISRLFHTYFRSTDWVK